VKNTDSDLVEREGSENFCLARTPGKFSDINEKIYLKTLYITDI
jgi:hypothetical protein